ncbi:MAG: putative metalloprotease CJM1_0395 family protein, partial [Planctomycetota bacterium JB042]
GEVSIDVSPVPGDPEATIRKMEVVRKAALAPQEPSVQDQRVAQKASVQEAQARRELTEQRNESLGADAADPRSRARRAYASTDPVLSPGVLFDATG